MPSEHAGRLVREPCANTGRDADMPSLPSRADRYYSAQGTGRAGRSRSRRPSWRTRDNAGIARALAFIQRHAVDDHLSSRLPAAEPVALRETESLGRHDAGPRATRKTNQRKTAKLFSVICSCAHSPVPDRARILHPALQTILRCFHPSLVDRLETIGSGQNLRRTQTDLSKLILRKVTSTASQIAAGITQDIDQLKSHAVASAKRKHFVRD